MLITLDNKDLEFNFNFAALKKPDNKYVINAQGMADNFNISGGVYYLYMTLKAEDLTGIINVLETVNPKAAKYEEELAEYIADDDDFYTNLFDELADLKLYKGLKKIQEQAEN